MEKPALKNVILMDPFPAMGHITAFLNLAKWLSEHGYEIVFIGSAEYQQIYLDEGFRFYELNPLIFIPEAFEMRNRGRFRFFLDNLYRSRDKRFLEYFQMTAKTYKRIIDEVKPDLVLLDLHYPLKAFFYNALNINVIMVSTMIIPVKGLGRPPTQSDHVPKNTRLSRIFISYLWLINRSNRTFINWILCLACLGKTDVSIIRRIFKDSPYTLDTSGCYGIGIQQVPLIATYPKAFDFESTQRSLFYFGQLKKVSSGEIDDPRLRALLKHLPKRKIIYCSMGATNFQHLKLCHRFFKMIVKVAVKNPQWHFLLHVGKYYDINKLPSTPGNLSTFVQVPQRLLLNRVAMMINHGGINSIKECISANIPMIVYLFSLKFDQPGCAARVAYHKLGIAGNIWKDTAKSLGAKIKFLMEHLDEYKNNIHDLNHRINKSTRSDNIRILSLIKHYVNKSLLKPSLHDTSKESVKKIPCSTNG